ncbi:Oxidoreductase-like protein, N-terminal [Stenotrophomonas lactitubi]|nr:Oxidoreductase-like protein, N-terminal [Stenotrophomonas sp. yr243]SNS52117.1 Oxidoreductase-like protein, N-terminal [Stenotrophomonas lactitubi]
MLPRGPTCAVNWALERAATLSTCNRVVLFPAVTVSDTPADPRPLPPEEPGPNECCGSGCPLCVLDLYTEELQRYRKVLAEWKARHPDADP